MADETIEISFDATLINLIQWLTDDLLRAKWTVRYHPQPSLPSVLETVETTAGADGWTSPIKCPLSPTHHPIKCDKLTTKTRTA